MFRKILSVITLILLAVVLWNARAEVMQAIDFLGDTNLAIILLLIPEQLFMYYCCGQIFFSYMAAKKTIKKIAPKDLMRISLELNFVNNAVPSGGVSGLGYITWRLASYGATAGQTSFMYLLRYAITILANQLQTILAIVVLLLIGRLDAGSIWMLGIVSLTCFAVMILILAAIAIASSKSRIEWFAKAGTKTINFLVRKITFGHKRNLLKEAKVRKYFLDIHKDLVEVKRNRKILSRPIFWGVAYSFLEVATYWIVGISMGRPDILPQIMVSEAIASVVGAVFVTPGGVGGYEGAMVFVMSALGVDVGLATAVVITTRVIVLVSTVASGYGFYQHAISRIGREERAEINRINKENHYE